MVINHLKDQSYGPHNQKNQFYEGHHLRDQSYVLQNLRGQSYGLHHPKDHFIRSSYHELMIFTSQGSIPWSSPYQYPSQGLILRLPHL